MPWVVDTCLVIDVFEADPQFGPATRELLAALAPEGLMLCPVSFIELAPAFNGDLERQRYFLQRAGIGFEEDWQPMDTIAAHAAWHRQVLHRRGAQAKRRPVADILIGAFTGRFRGLLTRNRDDFAPAFPELRIVTPKAKR